MKQIEIRAQYITDTAWELARDNGAEFFQKEYAVKEICDFCGKSRGLGFVYWRKNKIICIWCEVRSLFE